MDKPLLADKEQFPTEEIIFSHIDESRIHWETIFGHIHINYPEFIGEWRYYYDGKSWLLKTTKKSKTIFWLSVVQDSFKITFYFGDKAEPVDCLQFHGQNDFGASNKRFHQAIAPVTSCAGAQAASSTLAGEADVGLK